MNEDDERVQVAPNTEAGGLHTRFHVRPGRRVAAQRRTAQRGWEEKPRWTDCVEEELDKQEEPEEEIEEEKMQEQQVGDECEEGGAEDQRREGERADGQGEEELETGEEKKREKAEKQEMEKDKR